MLLEGTPLGVDPDGKARWLVRVTFRDAGGHDTTLLSGGNLDYFAWPGSAQWQTRARFGAPSAIVTTTLDGPLRLRVRMTSPAGVPDARAESDTRSWPGTRVVAKALGPHLAVVGWFPRETSSDVRIVRSDERDRRSVTMLEPPSSSYRDPTVEPGARYKYIVSRSGAATVSFTVHVPPEPPHTELALRGKGMWLTFSPSTLDDDSYTRLDPAAIVAQGRRAGLRYIELRTAYGEYWEVTPQAKPTVDALLDSAADAGIAVVGWTVPRTPPFEDLENSVRVAYYRTPRGTRFAGLAIDLERGEDYLGAGSSAPSTLAEYSRRARSALGPQYPVAAIVEDPHLERLTNRDVPYSTIAENCDVLQPMMYWRMLSRRTRTVQAVEGVIKDSLAALRREVGTRVQVNVGGQTVALGGEGAPPPDEISAALAQSRRGGAIGVTYFEWQGTSAAQWTALGRYPW